jgi:hypothetical protein
MSLTIDEMYPARLYIDFPNRALDRVSTFLRLIYAIPAVILLSFIGGVAFGDAGDGGRMGAVAGGVLVTPVIFMVLFRQKYPRWWFDFNLQPTRFSTRVMSYLALMSDRYPSTDGPRSSSDGTCTHPCHRICCQLGLARVEAVSDTPTNLIPTTSGSSTSHAVFT